MVMPHDYEIKHFYDEEYIQHTPSLDFEDTSFKINEISLILKKNNIKNISSIFDMGCGSGVIAKTLSKKFNTYIIVGCDISSSIIKTSLKIVQEFSRIICDVECVPIRDKIFEVVLLIDLIEHVRYPNKILLEVARITKNYIIIRVPIEDCLYHNLRKGKNNWLNEWKIYCGHLHKFNLSQIIN